MYSNGTSSDNVLYREVDAALERSRRPCLDGIGVVNTATGCGYGCLFCNRTRAGRTSENIIVKVNLPHVLEQELARRAGGPRALKAVLFNTATDCFQPVDGMLELTAKAMDVVFSHGLYVFFVTRSDVPDAFEQLFRSHRDRIRAQVSLFTVDDALSAKYEPFAPPPMRRLDGMRKLAAWGVDVTARIDPIIPLLADTTAHFEQTLRFVYSAGVRKAIASYLILRPHLLEVFESSLPPTHFQLIKGSFKGQGWLKMGLHRMAKLLPSRIRNGGYSRLKRVADKLGMQLVICSCDNPEYEGICFTLPDPRRERLPESGQLALFAHDGN